MAVDPWIARGSPPIDITSTLAQIAALKQRDRAIATAEERTRNDAARQAKEDAEDADEEARFDRALATEDWVTAARIDPTATAAIRKIKGLDKDPDDGKPKLGAVSPGDYTPESLAKFQQSGSLADLVRYVAPERPQQYGPETYETVDLEDGIYSVSRRNPGKKVRIGKPPPKAGDEPKEPKLYPDGLGGWYRLDDQGRMVPVPVAEDGAAPPPKPAAAKPPKGGQAKSKSGRPIVWRNGQWEYVQQGDK